jgi:hypothetical protein
VAVIVAPSTQTVPSGSAFEPNRIASVVLNTGDSITFGFASAQPDPGVTRTTFNFSLYRAGTTELLVHRDTLWTETNVLVTYTADTPIGVELGLSGGGFPAGTSHGIVLGYHAETSVLVGGNCQYGTQPKPQYAGVLNITDQLIDIVLSRYGANWLRRVIAQLLWGTVDTNALCGAGPPPLPPIDTSTLQASIGTALQIWRALLWAEVCECAPGAPAPTPYPPYVVIQPPGWPPTLVFDCANTDLCAAVVKLQQQMAVLLTGTGTVLELTTLMQRNLLPMAYVPGPLHENLSGSLAFGVTRLVGIKVSLKAAPDGLTAFTGLPLYITDLGWLSIVTAEGLVDEIRYTRQEQVWMPRHMPTALSVGVALREGVVVDVLELKPEP